MTKSSRRQESFLTSRYSREDATNPTEMDGLARVGMPSRHATLADHEPESVSNLHNFGDNWATVDSFLGRNGSTAEIRMRTVVQERDTSTNALLYLRAVLPLIPRNELAGATTQE